MRGVIELTSKTQKIRDLNYYCKNPFKVSEKTNKKPLSQFLDSDSVCVFFHVQIVEETSEREKSE